MTRSASGRDRPSSNHRLARRPVPTEVAPLFSPVVQAFAADRQVSYGKLMASYGLRVKGKIFAMLVRGRLVAKLPRGRVDELVRGGQGERFEVGPGRLMKEWIAVAPGEADWIELSREAHRFVSGGAG
jgi:hypothetical protein